MRNQRSNSAAAFAFFDQCAANPSSPFCASHSGLTPTADQSKPGLGAGYAAKNSQ